MTKPTFLLFLCDDDAQVCDNAENRALLVERTLARCSTTRTHTTRASEPTNETWDIRTMRTGVTGDERGRECRKRASRVEEGVREYDARTLVGSHELNARAKTPQAPRNNEGA